MARESRTLTVYTCDRCGRIDNPLEGRWAWINGQVSGPADDETALFRDRAFHEQDICPSCVRSFRSWWEDARQ